MAKRVKRVAKVAPKYRKLTDRDMVQGVAHVRRRLRDNEAALRKR